MQIRAMDLICHGKKYSRSTKMLIPSCLLMMITPPFLTSKMMPQPHHQLQTILHLPPIIKVSPDDVWDYTLDRKQFMLGWP